MGCAAKETGPVAQFPPAPNFPPDHRYTLDDLVRLSIFHNASLDVSRYEAEAAQGIVDQVKSLWLPMLHYNFTATAFDNDMNYRARAFNLLTINVPITGAYNISNSLAFAQILATGGKRTSGLKQAQMFAVLKKFDVLRQQDAVAQDVATYYHLVCLANDVDAALEDAERRLRVFKQVSAGLNQRGSLRGNDLDTLQADYFVSQLSQLRVAVQAGRHQAFAALRQAVGVSRDEPLVLKNVSLPPALKLDEKISAYAAIAKGFLARPETREVDLFAKIRAEQVNFAKASGMPNFVFLGNVINIQGNHNTILDAVDGLLATVVINVPIYDPGYRGRIREALGMEQASLAFQRQIEELITLEIEVTAVECQKALATALKTERAQKTAAEHYDAARQAYSRELVPASAVVTGLGLDLFAKLSNLQALFAYHNCKARLKRVTADREAPYGY